MRPGTGDGLAACTGGGLAACTSSTCSRNCLVSSCRFSLRAFTRSCFESRLVVPYLPQVIWETGWRRAVYFMLPGQLLHPRVPNRGDVLRTWARGGALFLEQTDGAPFLVRGLSILHPCSECMRARLWTRSRSTSNHWTCTRLTLPCPWVFERGAQSTGCGESPKLVLMLMLLLMLMLVSVSSYQYSSFYGAGSAQAHRG